MDTRTMHYFLTIAQEGSFTKAAEALHMTQPPLSRQIKELEAELGVTLIDRSGKRIALTEEGLAFRERAQEVVDLMRQIKSDTGVDAKNLTGEVRVACGETDAVTLLAQGAKALQRRHPSITYRLLSGDRDFVLDKLERNGADIGLLVVSSVDSEKYDFLKMPARDAWGVLMRADDPLAQSSGIEPAQLTAAPLLLPYRAAMGSDLMAWFGVNRGKLNVVGTYDLAYNASRFAKEGFGYAVVLDGIVEATEESGLAFRPLSPRLEAELFLVWKRHPRPSRAVEAFLEEICLLTGASAKA